MSTVTPVDSAGTSNPADATTPDSQVQQAFQEGIANFMLAFLQSAESDLTEAINDKTSDPDSPG